MKPSERVQSEYRVRLLSSGVASKLYSMSDYYSAISKPSPLDSANQSAGFKSMSFWAPFDKLENR